MLYAISTSLKELTDPNSNLHTWQLACKNIPLSAITKDILFFIQQKFPAELVLMKKQYEQLGHGDPGLSLAVVASNAETIIYVTPQGGKGFSLDLPPTGIGSDPKINVDVNSEVYQSQRSFFAGIEERRRHSEALVKDFQKSWKLLFEGLYQHINSSAELARVVTHLNERVDNMKEVVSQSQKEMEETQATVQRSKEEQEKLYQNMEAADLPKLLLNRFELAEAVSTLRKSVADAPVQIQGDLTQMLDLLNQILNWKGEQASTSSQKAQVIPLNYKAVKNECNDD